MFINERVTHENLINFGKVDIVYDYLDSGFAHVLFESIEGARFPVGTLIAQDGGYWVGTTRSGKKTRRYAIDVNAATEMSVRWLNEVRSR